MAKKKQKPKSRAKKQAHEPIDWKRATRHTTSALIVAIFVCLGIAWAFGLGALRGHVSEFDTSADTVRLRLNWPLISEEGTPASGQDEQQAVPYMGRERGQALLAELRHHVTTDAFDQSALRSACESLESSGWLKRGARATRLPGNLIEISGSWRHPRWVVRYQGYDYVIGGDFGLLPLRVPIGEQQVRVAAGEALRFIDGVENGPPVVSTTGLAYGRAWPGSDVEIATTLLSLLAREPEIWPQIAGVRLDRREWNVLLVIVTDQGGEIMWGRQPGTEGGTEVSTDVKLAHLKAARRHTGRIDWGEAWSDVRTEQFEIDRTARPEGGP